MNSILIKDTTREERIRIVHQALWGACGIDCEFCSEAAEQKAFTSRISTGSKRSGRSTRNSARRLSAGEAAVRRNITLRRKDRVI